MPLNISPRDFHQRERLYQQLGQMLGAGLPIINALEALSRNPPTAAYREPIQKIVLQLKSGATIVEAWQSLNKFVPQFDISLIGAGEKSGRLDQVFRLLASYYRERAALARLIFSELAYPVFLFHFSIFLFPLVNCIVGKLSWEGLLINVGCILVPIYGIALFLLFASQGKRGEFWRGIMEKVCRLVPVLGTARRAMALARLATALEALLSAGMNIIQAWELAAASSGSPAMHRAVLNWRQYLEEGQTPAQVVQGTPREFPEIFANLYGTGEISGQLDDTLIRLRTYYEEEATFKFRMASKLFSKAVYFSVVGYVVYLILGYYSSYNNQLNEIMK